MSTQRRATGHLKLRPFLSEQSGERTGALAGLELGCEALDLGIPLGPVEPRTVAARGEPLEVVEPTCGSGAGWPADYCGC